MSYTADVKQDGRKGRCVKESGHVGRGSTNYWVFPRTAKGGALVDDLAVVEILRLHL